MRIKDVLHKKRKATEDHIKRLRNDGKQGVRYTAMMPDIPFLILGLISDIGWLIRLVAGILYFCRNGFHHVLDDMALIALAAVLFGVADLILIPFAAKHLNAYTCIAIAGATSEDTTLPMIMRNTDAQTAVFSVINGVICSTFVPILFSICY